MGATGDAGQARGVRVRDQVVVALSLALLGCALDRGGSGSGVRSAVRAPDASAELDAGALDGGEQRDAAPDDATLAHDASFARVDASAPSADDASAPDAGRPPLCSSDPALVACYPFDGDALDHGPRANHLSASAVTFEPGGGVLLGAASSLVRAHRPELSHTETTLLLWVRLDALPTVGRAGIVDHDGQYGLFVHPGGELRCSMAIAGAGVASAPAVLDTGHWHHVACAAQGTTARLFVDGVMVASTPAGTRVSGATPLHIGENGPTGDDQLTGAIDDVRLWDAEWTAEQVAADAQRGR
jgi:hypothetical protein